ncbi:MAG TPA: biotin/lipoate A/B protein ligase family protein [bacterium]|nr:lipoate--protein ligase family protein [Myxococcales bacterium]OQA61827.1 MAG: Octanoyltransferase LipM [bacterium ADurb.Bin270]HPW45336.1 biotin/lipoate A/B protein ligase family protein [bacterium]HQC50431.1 biotin/lipoate A/B protein ligase family protein [bacterium]
MWRIIPEKDFCAAMNMALDEAIMERVRLGADPTIRFYSWNPSAVSIGYFQGYENEVNEEACRSSGTEIVRRITGGGAVYHDRKGEITYSLIAPEQIYPSEIAASYEVICGHIVEALTSIGIAARFSPINDVVINERKLSGSAQTRKKGVLLQHGTILYSVDVEKMFSLLRVPDEKMRDKLVKSVMKRVSSVKEQNPRISRGELGQALFHAFTKGKKWRRGDYLPEELSRALEIARIRYSERGWTTQR